MSEQKKNYATKISRPTECDPFYYMEDIKKVVEWFENNNEWDGYLITMLGLLLGRRIGDTISMKWSDLYYEDGKQKQEINSVIEQKTGKTIPLALSKTIFEAIGKYLENTNVEPMEHYNDYIFEYCSRTEWLNIDRKYFSAGTCSLGFTDVEEWVEFFRKDWSDKRISEIQKGFEKQLSKKSKKYGSYDNVFDYIHYVVDYKDVVKWQADDYRKKLNRAAIEAGILYQVSTHTLRKTFAYWIYNNHIFDPNCAHALQKMFGHASILQTFDYMCVTKMRNKKYLEDHGEFIHNVLEGNGIEIIKNMPVISLKSDDFGNIIRSVIKGMSDGRDVLDVYQDAINEANSLRVS